MNNISWKSFILSDIFEIKSTKNGIDKNKLTNINLKGNIPYITRTDKNNGIDTFITPQNYEINKGNVIIIGLDTQTAFYQESDFYTGQNIQILSNESINKYNAIYLINLLKILLKKFNWGGNGATLTRLRNSRIYLPINNKQLPNYQYMENTIKEIENKKISEYKQYCQNKLKDIEYKEISPLENKKYKSFVLEDILKIYSSKGKIDKNKLNNHAGKFPYITRTDKNNGIESFIDFQEGIKPNIKNKLIVGGDTQTVFYENYDFYTGDKIIITENENLNEYSYLFLSTILKEALSKHKYGGNAITQKRLRRLKIMLPVDSDNEPDYKYMEQYIKNIMHIKYKKYLEHIEKKTIIFN